ncbi:hypothetical protein [Cupriavidus sp. UYPR2.512]|uniref:hypothetical protein n=1 Tax=Cupriavidus sp. UYPR2.512 TaxID=1080187 RepID=UPI0012F98A66|nr:hypothetical protein [Cupriavidus sp. UYPR2.512]UIF86613.1 hypothetical protein KAF44_02915 [Cupriavidus necator]
MDQLLLLQERLTYSPPPHLKLRLHGMPRSVPGEFNLAIAAIPINRAFAWAVSLMKRISGAAKNCRTLITSSPV